jgi:hypothetical protein
MAAPDGREGRGWRVSDEGGIFRCQNFWQQAKAREG